jgi:hypothetical protein
MADKKRDILEFVELSNFEQMIPTLKDQDLKVKCLGSREFESQYNTSICQVYQYFNRKMSNFMFNRINASDRISKGLFK